MAQPPIQPEPRPHRPGDPRERRPAVGVDPVEVVERRRDEQHRHEGRQQHAGGVHADQRDERPDDGGQRVRRRRRRQPDHQELEEPDGARAGGSASRVLRGVGLLRTCRVGAHATVIAVRVARPASVSEVAILFTQRNRVALAVRSYSSEGAPCASCSSAPVEWAARSRRSPPAATSSSGWWSPTTTAPRAEKAVAAAGDPRFVAARVDATDERRRRRPAGRAPLRRAAQRHRPALRDAAVPRGAGRRRRTTSTWRCRCRGRTPSEPYEETGVKLGDEQFALADEWEAAGRLALVGMGVEPGPGRRLRPLRRRRAVLRDRRARRPGRLEPHRARPRLRAVVLIWTTIEECLNPPVVWEKDRGWFTTAPFSEPEVFDFPEGIGPVECVNVEHEEVLLMPRWIDARPGDLQVRAGRGVHRRAAGRCTSSAWTDRRRYACGGVEVSPRDVVAAVLPDPARLGELMCGKTCAGPVGAAARGTDGPPAAGVPLPRRRQRVVDGGVRRPGGGLADRGQPGRRPRAAGDRARGAAPASSGPEAFDAAPFLDLLTAYGSPWGMREGG